MGLTLLARYYLKLKTHPEFREYLNSFDEIHSFDAESFHALKSIHLGVDPFVLLFIRQYAEGYAKLFGRADPKRLFLNPIPAAALGRPIEIDVNISDQAKLEISHTSIELQYMNMKNLRPSE